MKQRSFSIRKVVGKFNEIALPIIGSLFAAVIASFGSLFFLRVIFGEQALGNAGEAAGMIFFLMGFVGVPLIAGFTGVFLTKLLKRNHTKNFIHSFIIFLICASIPFLYFLISIATET